MHYEFGADETMPAGVFVRWIAPTDIQKVSEQMARIIKDYYPGMDLLNPTLWHLIGTFTYEGPILEYLQRVIALEREWTRSLDSSSANAFKTELRSRHGYNVDDITTYTRAYLQAMAEGLIPESIRQPWSYTPTSTAEDVGAVAAQSLKSLWPYLFGAVAVYALVSVFVPNLIGSLAYSKRR